MIQLRKSDSYFSRYGFPYSDGSRLGLVVAILLLWVIASPQQSHGQEPWPSIRTSTSLAEEKVYKSLSDTTEVEFVDVPVSEALAFLADRHGSPIKLDGRALKELEITRDAPVTLNVKGITLRSALRLLLNDLNLEFIVQNEVILVTSASRLNQFKEVRIYNVSELTGDESADYLADVLRKLDKSAGPKRNSDGEKIKGSRTIVVYDDTLVVQDTIKGHEVLGRLLRAIEQAKSLKQMN